MTHLDAAVGYAHRGWKVHPLKERAKLPLTEHGHKDATDDLGQVMAWWGKTPAANIGVSCRASGLLVLDVDPRHGGERPEGLPPTVEAQTGGGGLHLFFQHPGDGVRLKGQLAAGVDAKSNGYVVVWPSIHPSGGMYRWAPGRGPDEVEIAELPPHILAALTETRPPPAPKVIRSATALETFAQAVEAYDYEHARDFGGGRSECPVCQVGRNSGGQGFGAGKGDNRWSCFSTSHSGCGRQADTGECWTGDVLDLDAYAEGCSPKELLVRRGYLARRSPPGPLPTPEAVLALARDAWSSSAPDGGGVPIADASEPETEAETGGGPVRVEGVAKNLTSLRRLLSPQSACAASILGGQPLSRNEMSGATELGGRPITDQDLSSIRLGLERVAKNKRGKPIQWAKSDVADVVEFVAGQNTVHPVRDWLRGLNWDGGDRLSQALPRALGQAEGSIQAAMLRRWLISAVARAMRPGCKVDTVLILVGKQGALKSSFFAAMGGQWFTDSPIDVGDKDAPQVMCTSWIVEWAELESMRRARDSESLKAFLASQRDTFRPSYGRYAITLPRSSVIVGSTNSEQFLSDDTGSRRFWPIGIGDSLINLEWVRLNREQLWAQAVRLFDAKEQWWLTPEEEAQRAKGARVHEVVDAWQGVVAGYLEGCGFADTVTTDELLHKAVGKPIGQWGRGDQMRVGRVLRDLGWASERPRAGNGPTRIRHYRRPIK